MVLLAGQTAAPGIANNWCSKRHDRTLTRISLEKGLGFRSSGFSKKPKYLVTVDIVDPYIRFRI